jgi:hypothetical protein
MKNANGFVLPAVIATLVIMMILVPILVVYTQNEAKWSQKQAANTTAFHMAEAGAEKAYHYITRSTTTWAALMLGNAPANYDFDRAYTDLEGGSYTISITSGPGEETATIISIGRDARNRETRAIKVIYSNSLFGATAIFAGQGAQIGGQVNVEWGAVMSPYTISADSRNHPQFWSASQIITKDTSPNPPNCDGPDCCQWHSYQTNLPPMPSIDFDYYRSSASLNTTGGCPAGGTPANSCYYTGSVTNWNHSTTGAIFIEGSLTVKSPGMDHIGNIVVMGNINLPNGAWGRGVGTMSMPPDAWKQYCNDWAHYLAEYDSGAPAAFPGLNSTAYTSPATCVPGACTSSKLAVQGMLYVGGNFNNGGGGGGNSDVYGVLYSVGSSSQTANSPVDFYFNADAADAVQTTNVTLVRVSWQDELRDWPTGL